MAIAPTALVMKITRASMLDQIGQDHIAFARARGLPERRVILVYGLRNALIPVLTAAGLLFVGLLTGTVFVETVFGLPGLGQPADRRRADQRPAGHPGPRPADRHLDRHRQPDHRPHLCRRRSPSRLRAPSELMTVATAIPADVAGDVPRPRRRRLRPPLSVLLGMAFFVAILLVSLFGRTLAGSPTRAEHPRHRPTAERGALARNRRPRPRRARPRSSPAPTRRSSVRC